VHLVGCFVEYLKMHRTTNPKFRKGMFLPVSFSAVLFTAGLGAEELNAMCWMEI
jgi:hypothetical protein